MEKDIYVSEARSLSESQASNCRLGSSIKELVHLTLGTNEILLIDYLILSRATPCHAGAQCYARMSQTAYANNVQTSGKVFKSGLDQYC